MPSIRVNRAPIRDVNRVGPALLIIMERYSTRFAWLEGYYRIMSIMFLVFLFLSGIAARQQNFRILDSFVCQTILLPVAHNINFCPEFAVFPKHSYFRHIASKFQTFLEWFQQFYIVMKELVRSQGGSNRRELKLPPFSTQKHFSPQDFTFRC